MFERVTVQKDESFNMDTQYFVVRAVQSRGMLRVERYDAETNMPTHVFTCEHLTDAEQAEALRKHIEKNFDLVPGHMAYLAYELGKAETALILGLEYTQDSPVTEE